LVHGCAGLPNLQLAGLALVKINIFIRLLKLRLIAMRKVLHRLRAPRAPCQESCRRRAQAAHQPEHLLHAQLISPSCFYLPLTRAALI